MRLLNGVRRIILRKRKLRGHERVRRLVLGGLVLRELILRNLILRELILGKLVGEVWIQAGNRGAWSSGLGHRERLRR